MKKIFIFIALVMGMVCGMNAQVVNDTVSYTDTVQFSIVNDTVTNISGGQTDNAVIYLDSAWIPSNGYISFFLDGLAEDMNLFIKIGDHVTGAFDVIDTYDTVYNYVYGDSIVRIDTIVVGHPGIFDLDTVYNVIDSTMVIDTIQSIQTMFINGLVNFRLNDYFTIDSFGAINSVEFYVVWDNQYLDPAIVSLTQIYMYDVNETLGISDVDADMVNVVVYPNPTSDYVNIVGDVNVNYVNVIDINGRNVIKTNSNVVDMKNLDNGIYFIRVMFVNGDMRTFKVCKY